MTAVSKSERNEVHAALTRLDAWIRSSDWKAYDPFDGLSSPYSRYVTFNKPLLKQVWLHVVRRFPINLRPLLSIKPATSTKAMGYFAQGYLRLYQTYGNQEYLDQMQFCLQWLMDNPSTGFHGHCWGNHFEGQTRGGVTAKNAPSIVWTGLIAHAFLDAYEALGVKHYHEIALSACEFIVRDLGWMEMEGGICLRYLPNGKNVIHNSNMIGAGLLARVGSIASNDRYREIAEKAVQFTVRHQTSEGAWTYGVGDQWKWVDSFHTGYVLEALDIFCRCAGDTKYHQAIEKGYRFFINNFFLPDGTPRYYDHKTSPIDIQCASQAIQTLVNLRAMDSRSLELAARVARWTIANMQDPTGYFYYRKYPFITNKTPTLHWAEGTMFAALALLDQRLNSEGANSLMPKASDVYRRSQPVPDRSSRRVPLSNLHKKANGLRYVLITPARNEEAFIELTIRSVIAQTLRPAKWVIVSDGSTDNTDAVVQKYTAEHEWIELVRRPQREERHFAGKVTAFKAGYDRVKDLDFEVIGNLDADITFDANYFAFLMRKFAENPGLGVGGTPFREGSEQYDYRFTSIEHVSGACQLFRRRCFEEIGGYVPIKGGGIDLVAVLTARMKGWQTRTFPEKTCEHHRLMGTASQGKLAFLLKGGERDYKLGIHPLWQFFRSLYQMTKRPFVLGGCSLLAGFFWAMLMREERPVSSELVRFRRKEQMKRLKQFFFRQNCRLDRTRNGVPPLALG